MLLAKTGLASISSSAMRGYWAPWPAKAKTAVAVRLFPSMDRERRTGAGFAGGDGGEGVQELVALGAYRYGSVLEGASEW